MPYTRRLSDTPHTLLPLPTTPHPRRLSSTHLDNLRLQTTEHTRRLSNIETRRLSDTRLSDRRHSQTNYIYKPNKPDIDLIRGIKKKPEVVEVQQGRKVQLRIEENCFEIVGEEQQKSGVVCRNSELVGLKCLSCVDVTKGGEPHTYHNRSKSFDSNFTRGKVEFFGGNEEESKLLPSPAKSPKNKLPWDKKPTKSYLLDPNLLGSAIEAHLYNKNRRSTFSELFNQNQNQDPTLSRPRSHSAHQIIPHAQLESNPFVKSDFILNEDVIQEENENFEENVGKKKNASRICCVLRRFFFRIVRLLFK